MKYADEDQLNIGDTSMTNIRNIRNSKRCKIDEQKI